MRFIRVPLLQRTEAARARQTVQPEYLPCLIQRWAKMPIQSYFGTCTEQLQQLYRILDLEAEENPSYQDVAGMLARRRCDGMGGEGMRLLAAPILAQWAARRKRKGGGANG